MCFGSSEVSKSSVWVHRRRSKASGPMEIAPSIVISVLKKIKGNQKCFLVAEKYFFIFLFHA